MKRKPYRPNPYLIHPKGYALSAERRGTSASAYNNLGYWFLLLIILVLAGFYHTYLSKILQPQAAIIHIHFGLMAIWIGMLIAQPFLIKYKKVALHRRVGRISYWVVPLAIFSGFLMLRDTYYRFIADAQQKAAQSLSPLASDELQRQAAAYVSVVVFWLAMFATFYTMAILNRKRSAVHARYMVAAALSLLGPTVDRIVVFILGLESLPAGLPIEIIAFFLANTTLALLLWNDYRYKRPISALRNSLLIYLLGQTLYFTLPLTDVWGHIMAFIMRPVP
ncbi:hypothetical protein GCM10023187_43020 [Nibrella viscosa]|uniref:Uncharacterized protein n=1 Tax=Nibrella viscosa TaxID=1084524 RepID=A0ABP8KS07_9BACT